MRVHVVSDVHGSAGALAKAAVGADALVILGDLLLYIDYADPSQGMVAELFGEPAAQHFAVLRRDHRFAELRQFGAEMVGGSGDPNGLIYGVARRQYAELFGVFPNPTYLTYGNVDIPALWPEFAREGVHPLDGQVAEIGGWTFGFAGGWVPKRSRGVRGISGPALRFGADCTAEEFAAKVEAIGAVDVLCSHVPPAVPELRYDTVARAFEVASPAILDAIRRTQPRYALFGHVHQPLAQRMRIGRTECVNVGHFRRSGEPFVLRW
jgi:Icc-related predicted phosphoesterase